MLLTTLCYIEKDGCYLMMLRNKKKNDPSSGKWIGAGGKMEPGECADDCVRREVLEETGLRLRTASYRGVVHFHSEVWESEEMYLYTSSDFEGELTSDCNEGDLKWIPFEEIMELSLWDGDRIFLKKLLDGENDIEMTLYYDSEGKLAGGEW